MHMFRAAKYCNEGKKILSYDILTGCQSCSHLDVDAPRAVTQLRHTAMTTFVWSIVNANETSVATDFCTATAARGLPRSIGRVGGCLESARAGDTLIIVAHGSDEEIGTAGDDVTYTVAGLVTQLTDVMGMPDRISIVLAACDTTVFARALQASFQLLSVQQRGREVYTHHSVTCRGQSGTFAFSRNSRF
jgi:hypothetical protein